MRVSGVVTLLCLACLVVASFGIPVVPRASSPAVTPLAAAAPVLASRVVRVAVYDESNLTRPAYATTGALNDNITGVVNVLTAAGCQVTALTAAQIANHALLTASYDVFVMVDNMPRESIVNQVKEFWLGGGGILSLDSAISFICYAGMIPPESEGSENHGVYWDYIGVFSDNNVTARHPATKAFHINDVATTTAVQWAVFLWTAISGSSVGSQLVRLGTQPGFATRASMVALDPTAKGGRVVQLPASGGTLTANMSAILSTTVNWLCPRPKARIVFDLSHQPRLGVDAWDELAGYKPRYSDLRNALVSRGYTFDKLYPSALGNFTAARLASYNLLMLVLPDYNLTAADRSAVTTWITAGGSLLAIGEGPWGYLAGDQQINQLLSGFGVSIDVDTSHYNGTSATVATKDAHPTTEGCTGIDMGYRGYINVTGSGGRIWYEGPNILFGADAHGAGRVILGADMNWLENLNLGSADNERFAINLVNWLTAATAKVLIYTDDVYSPNVYRTPVSLALNDLGVKFALTFTFDYLNRSLHWYSWDLVVVDCATYFGLSTYLDDLASYVDAGGRLLLSYYDLDHDPTHPLWPKLGVAGASDITSDAPVYIWDTSHSIFTSPNAYGAANFTSAGLYSDNGDSLTVFANATALAGLSATATAGQATIVVRNDRRTLFNSYLIDEFDTDMDDSTYPDRLELWENEIAFMLVPLVTVPTLPWWLLPLVLVILVVVIIIVVVVLLLRRRKASAK